MRTMRLVLTKNRPLRLHLLAWLLAAWGSVVSGQSQAPPKPKNPIPCPLVITQVAKDADRSDGPDRFSPSRLLIVEPDGTPYDGDPRWALKRMLKKAAKSGYTFYVGPELEYFYFQDTASTPVTLDAGGYFDLTPLPFSPKRGFGMNVA